jgi:hypothetical protein
VCEERAQKRTGKDGSSLEEDGARLIKNLLHLDVMDQHR